MTRATERAGRNTWRARALALLLSVIASPCARAQEAEYFPEEQKPRLVLEWDFLARYDRIEKLLFRPDIFRGRFEARPELDLVFSQRLRVGVRAVADLGTDSNAGNDRNFDNYRSNGVTLERYFVEAKPGRFALRAGSFGMPLVATEMLWDRDIQTLGAAAAYEIPAGASSITIAGAGFRGPQREGDRTTVASGQVVWRMGDPASLSLEAAASYWHFQAKDLNPLFIRQNYFEIDPFGRARYISRFQVVDALVRLRFPVGRAPITISLDGVLNLGARREAEHDGSAFEGSILIGSVGTPGDIRGFYTFQYVERDALPGAYNTDDWWLHTWYKGHRFGLAVTVYPRVFIQASGMVQRRLGRRNHLNRLTVDLVKMF